MKTKLIFASLLIASTAHADPYVGIGYGGRSGAINADAGYQFTPTLGTELDYINEGIQPHSPNDNEVVTLDIVGTMPVYKSLSIYGKTGIADNIQRNDFVVVRRMRLYALIDVVDLSADRRRELIASVQVQRVRASTVTDTDIRIGVGS